MDEPAIELDPCLVCLGTSHWTEMRGCGYVLCDECQLLPSSAVERILAARRKACDTGYEEARRGTRIFPTSRAERAERERDEARASARLVEADHQRFRIGVSELLTETAEKRDEANARADRAEATLARERGFMAEGVAGVRDVVAARERELTAAREALRGVLAKHPTCEMRGCTRLATRLHPRQSTVYCDAHDNGSCEPLPNADAVRAAERALGGGA